MNVPAGETGPGGPPAAGDECRALLFDFGNVIVDVDFSRVLGHWAEASGRSADSLRERFGFDVHYERHERGEIDSPAYFASLRETLEVDLSDEQLGEGWNRLFGTEIPGIRDVLARAARRVPLYAFSNTNPMHYREWSSRFPDLFAPFARVFTSCDLARRKPERAAYDAVAAAIGVDAGHILFFDDSVENIHGARAAGMQAVHFTRIDDAHAALRARFGEDW